MGLLSHLDLVRLFDRAIRRAAIPISFTGGFHPGPRIAIANALALGATSSGEIADFELKADMELSEFQTKLTAQLPPEIPIYRVEEVDLKSPSATQILEQAEYLITVSTIEDNSPEQWQQWIDTIKNSSAIIWSKTTKKGKKQEVNLCDRLFALDIESILPNNSVVLRYLGSCRNDGTKISPENIIYMLEKTTNKEFELLQIHRQQLILN
jgi:radical SAM-linked protein